MWLNALCAQLQEQQHQQQTTPNNNNKIISNFSLTECAHIHFWIDIIIMWLCARNGWKSNLPPAIRNNKENKKKNIFHLPSSIHPFCCDYYYCYYSAMVFHFFSLAVYFFYHFVFFLFFFVHLSPRVFSANNASFCENDGNIQAPRQQQQQQRQLLNFNYCKSCKGNESVWHQYCAACMRHPLPSKHSDFLRVRNTLFWPCRVQSSWWRCCTVSHHHHHRQHFFFARSIYHLVDRVSWWDPTFKCIS